MNIKIVTHIVPIAVITTLIFLIPTVVKANHSLELTSTAFIDKGVFPTEFTCEGKGISPPLSWSGVPDEAKSLVVIMDHMPHQNPKPNINTLKEPSPIGPEKLRWYWGMYNIPVQNLEVKSGQVVGLLGNNVVNHKNEYTPVCSKGLGPKNYTFHVYALSTTLELSSIKNVSEATLRKAMDTFILDSDSLTVSFERSCQNPERPHPKHKNQPQQETVEPASALPLCDQQ